MRKKDNMGAKLEELDTVVLPEALPKVSTTPKGKLVKRDEPGKRQHNESEKSRRNLLKHDYERLRSVVPNADDFQKQTTLSLLHKARILIRNLETKEKKYKKFKGELMREQKYLKRRLDQLLHLINGGAIGVGNTLLLSVPAQQPPPAPAPVSPKQLVYDSSPIEISVPHILKRKQILLTKTTAEPQIVITNIMSGGNVLQPESLCLMIDEMEHLEGVPGFRVPQTKTEREEYCEQGEEDATEEIIETEIVDSIYGV